MDIEYFTMNTRPEDWNDEKFGPWLGPVTLIKTALPPSNKSAVRANYRHPVIGFGTVPSDRLGLRDPYRVIYFWKCINCPSKNGMLSFCKHLAALLKAISFRESYRNTARGIDLLNTVAEDSRQAIQILPDPRISSQLPQNVRRKTWRNRRTTIGGQINPLYNFLSTSSVQTTVVRTPATIGSSVAASGTSPTSSAASASSATGSASQRSALVAVPAASGPVGAARIPAPQALPGAQRQQASGTVKITPVFFNNHSTLFRISKLGFKPSTYEPYHSHSERGISATLHHSSSFSPSTPTWPTIHCETPSGSWSHK